MNPKLYAALDALEIESLQAERKRDDYVSRGMMENAQYQDGRAEGIRAAIVGIRASFLA